MKDPLKNIFKKYLHIIYMDYETFINSTLSHDYFKILDTNNNGSCCYDSILKLLKRNNLVLPNMNTKILQCKAVNWIIEHKYIYLYEYDLTLEDLVLYTHNFDTFQEYIKYYKVYCADKNTISNSLRWGGTPELIALSNIYNVNINVYTGKSFNKKFNKIIKGVIISNKPRKDLRYKLLLSTKNSLLFLTTLDTTLNILYIKYKNNSSHFKCLLETS